MADCDDQQRSRSRTVLAQRGEDQVQNTVEARRQAGLEPFIQSNFHGKNVINSGSLES